MNNKEINQKISEGMIHIRTIIEVAGKPKKYVEDTLKDYVKKIKSSYSVTSEHFEKATEKENFFSSFVELEILMKNAEAIIFFSFDYMPASIEILEPETLILKNNELSGFLNDLLTRLHGLNTGIITEKENTRFFVKNTAVLLRNFLIVILSSQPLTIDQIHPLMGVKKEDILKVINILIKEGKIEKQGDLYRAVGKKND
jgi:hypothetical protein